jgi:hypothetical protein
MPSNKRARIPRTSTSTSIPAHANGHGHANGNGNGLTHSASAPAISSSALKVKIKGPRGNAVKSKGKSRAYDDQGLVVPDPYCSFCTGTKAANKLGRPENMVSCHLCGRSGHFSCLDMTSPDLISIVQSYAWTCIECKTCEECALKENEVSQQDLKGREGADG